MFVEVRSYRPVTKRLVSVVVLFMLVIQTFWFRIPHVKFFLNFFFVSDYVFNLEDVRTNKVSPFIGYKVKTIGYKWKLQRIAQTVWGNSCQTTKHWTLLVSQTDLFLENVAPTFRKKEVQCGSVDRCKMGRTFSD